MLHCPRTLVATQPAPWATGVLYDSDLLGSVRPRARPGHGQYKSVFLKLDGQRIPVTVAYEAATKRSSSTRP
jgi:hypothetical protein